ncbi:glucans biosynthesis glucosyltransferase MdoH [Roseicitreum antarcticum]|uniref:Glucans biosynthesis glucosyltransferase H n=1 Tax=Roseicitreum antarcticum TaxID=564137 RepID=A0A1H2ZCL3_9RHOB|nr:glucans biosynthesis glucosyltransferase MdoH [Roseicitreum antarcticum]SDX15243.1 Methyltransferase domain-containing protein [Roseicitreum antarcticum]
MKRGALLRRWQMIATAALSALLVLALWYGLDRGATHPGLSALVLVLFAVNTVWLAGTAVTALMGMARDTDARDPSPRAVVAPALPVRLSEHDAARDEAPGPCAILWLTCGEDPAPLARRIGAMLTGLRQTGQDAGCRIFVLSDTRGADARAQEVAVLGPLAGQITYRNRTAPTGRKPGNLRDWLEQYGAGFETMLVLDADSTFSATRLAELRSQMACDPCLGLLQSAIRLRPAPSRFAGVQRLSGRLCGPVFARGLARLSGDAGNYWGHNALLRRAAFAQVCDLPPLPGRPPFGGPVLSHDFIEAAYLRRAGWAVQIVPDSRGSFEDAPDTIAAHLRRDRRWAQGNLQHLLLIAGPGLHPASRLHLLAGIQSYLSAPIWLALVLLTGSGAVHMTGAALWPLAGTMGLLMVPKLAGAASYGRAALWPRRRRVIWRSVGAELVLSTLLAPLGLIRRTGAVLSVLSGRDCGWVPAGTSGPRALVPGRAEVASGLAILLAVTLPQLLIGGGASMVAEGFDTAAPGSGAPDTASAVGWRSALVAALMVMPIVVPLLVAPRLTRWFDGPRPQRCAAAASGDPIAAYYDASTRRFLKLGGSGAALAIHRPLWAPGIADAEAAAAHVNTLVARAAEDALGRPPERVRDLGCGVGGTLLQLATRWPQAELSGLTLSAEQVRLAERHVAARGMASRIRVLRSDFGLPTTLPRADLVIAIESHVHADSAAGFLRSAHAHIASGGVLVIIDDMLAHPVSALDYRAARLVAAFRRGWRLGHVTPAQGLVAAAEGMGYRLLDQTDLSPMLRLNRWRDQALRLAGPMADTLGLARVPLFANMIGGNALTQAHRAGIMSYRLVVLREASSPAATRDVPDRQLTVDASGRTAA